MYQDERKLDFKPLGIAIKKAREAKGWTQEYLAQLVDLTPRSIMYIENRGQHPRLNKFYLITTGSVKYFSQKSLRGLARTKSASNGGVLRGDLQVLHVHVLLVAPLSTGYMTQSGTN